MAPTFYSMAGEEVILPKRFQQAIRAVTKAVHCMGCSHCHYAAPKEEPVDGALDKSASRGNEKRPSSAGLDEATEELCKKDLRIKNYALIACLFAFIFITIGSGLHLSPTAAFIDALSGTPLVIVAFSRWRNAQYRDEVRKEELASRVVQLRAPGELRL